MIVRQQIIMRASATALVITGLYWLHGIVERLLVPEEVNAALRQARDAPASGVSITSLHLPDITVACFALVAVTVIWAKQFDKSSNNKEIK